MLINRFSDEYDSNIALSIWSATGSMTAAAQKMEWKMVVAGKLKNGFGYLIRVSLLCTYCKQSVQTTIAFKETNKKVLLSII